MKAFTRAALLSVFATYFLVFIGGLVRVSGAGLGCPDWPHCFGGWFPPVSEAHLLQLQQHAEPGTILSQIQPEHFNYTLAWIEYLNRLVGVAVGFCILAMVVVAVLKTRKYKGLVWGSIGVLLLTGFQGWLGGMGGNWGSELQPSLPLNREPLIEAAQLT